MVLPTTHFYTLALLVFSLICFSLWPNLLKLASPPWRYELFSLDFALGALALSVVAAFSLGTLGRELSFTDRMIVAGGAAEVPILVAGIVFAFGDVLLLAAISSLGIVFAFPVTFGSAFGTMAALRLAFGGSRLLFLATLFLACSVVLAGLGASRLVATRTRARKGITVGILSGAALGFVPSILKLTSDPEFGPGPYASILMLSIGVVISTPACALFLMHIKIIGEPISFPHYVKGTARQHSLGLLAGVIWAIGALSVLLAISVPGELAPGSPAVLLVPACSVLICMLIAVFRWSELTKTSLQSKSWIGLSAALLAGGLAVFSFCLSS